MKAKKENTAQNKSQGTLDTMNKNPFGSLLKPLDNVKNFPERVVSGLEKLLESPFANDH